MVVRGTALFEKRGRGVFINSRKGFSLVELMITVALVGIIASLGPNLLLNIFQFFRLQMARANVQKNARTSLELINRNLRQATASTVVVSQQTGQSPYSWIQFKVDKGTGSAVGSYGFYQEGKYLKYMKNGSTSTIADNLRYVAFTYPKSDLSSIVSVSMTFEEATYAGYTKALQLSIEKVRVMN